MDKTTYQLVRIAAAAGGMQINANSKTTDQLIKIASAGDSCVFFLILRVEKSIMPKSNG
jgi:hypothetical protein